MYIYFSLTKCSFKGFLLNFLKAALCGSPPIGSPTSAPRVPPDSEIYHGSSRFRNLPNVPQYCFFELPFRVPFSSTL